eukprot:546194-Pelagomonas_calceolata.AAC.3
MPPSEARALGSRDSTEEPPMRASCLTGMLYLSFKLLTSASCAQSNHATHPDLTPWRWQASILGPHRPIQTLD